MTATSPIIRIEQAGLGADAQVRLVVSGPFDLEKLRHVWSSSGATVQRHGERLHATTTVQALARAAGRAFGAEESQRFERILLDAIEAWSTRPRPVPVSHGILATDQRPLVMGIVNVTPDSFAEVAPLYPGNHPAAAIEHGRALLAQGADILDVGGESTRPGAEPVPEDEELGRVVPVVTELAARGAVISIDTSKAAVAAAALEAGAAIVNDVLGANNDELLEVVARSGAGYILMHSRGTPQTMTSLAVYDDVVAEVFEFLVHGVERCLEAGIALDRIIVDPGIGFAKTPEHNLALLHGLRQFRSLGRPVLVGASRKSFLGALLDGAETDDRLEGSLACVAVAVHEGASVVRVHDVAASVRTARVAHAIATASTEWPDAAR